MPLWVLLTEASLFFTQLQPLAVQIGRISERQLQVSMIILQLYVYVVQHVTLVITKLNTATSEDVLLSRLMTVPSASEKRRKVAFLKRVCWRFVTKFLVLWIAHNDLARRTCSIPAWCSWSTRKHVPWNHIDNKGMKPYWQYRLSPYQELTIASTERILHKKRQRLKGTWTTYWTF